MKIRNQVLKYSAVVVGAVASVPAFAALPTSVAADATSAGADALTLGGIVLGIVVAIALFKMIKRAA